jgi:hypothetical protein
MPYFGFIEEYFKNVKPAIEEQYKNLKQPTCNIPTKDCIIMYDDKEWYFSQLNNFITTNGI